MHKTRRSTMENHRKHRYHLNRQRSLHSVVTKIVFVCLIASTIPTCQGFFFPKSFFRKTAPNNNPPPPQQQQHPRVLAGGTNGQHYGRDPLQISGSDVNPSLRIVNRPPPPRNSDQLQQPSGPVPGSGFHVPKELCLACERFPWMPVAGGAKQLTSGPPSPPRQPHTQQQQYQPNLSTAQSSSPTKTIVINALGEAPGPVPLPQVPPSRRPFAIQFDGSQSSNQVNYKESSKNPTINSHQINTQQRPNQPSAERPVSFQIYQAEPQRPTLLQPAFHNPSAQIVGLQTPPISQPVPQQSYGRPTVLQPTNNAISSQQVHNSGTANLNLHGNNGNAPPPNPLVVGNVIAAQHNNVALPEFHQIEQANLVYQEHVTSQTSQSAPSAPQNFKLPIISHPTSSASNTQSSSNTFSAPPAPQVPPQQNYGPPPQGQYQQGPPPQGQNQQKSPTQGQFQQGPPQQGQFQQGPPPQGQFLQGQYQQGLSLHMKPPAPYQPPRPTQSMAPPGPMIHYGQPIRIPNNIGPQRPSGQVFFPPPQAFLQMSPPPPPTQFQTNVMYGAPRPTTNTQNPGIRPQDERRPSPSGHVFNIQPPANQQNNLPPPNQGLNTNAVPVPIPVPTSVPTSNSLHQAQVNNNGIERPNQKPEAPTFTQETGWEIIPSIQTDLTHLFANENINQVSQSGNGLPVPVPIPVPQSHPPKSPYFIVAGANQQQQQLQETQPEPQITVQDVTYHEEGKNLTPSGSTPSKTVTEAQSGNVSEQELTQANSVNTVETQHQEEQRPQQPQQQPIQPQVIRPRPFILGVPTGPARPVIFRPRPQQQLYEPLPPSIMTALNHAQQTSLLTHQYLSQSKVRQPISENAIFVSPVIPTVASAQSQHHLQTNSPLQETVSNSVQESGNRNPQYLNQGIDPRIPVVRPGTVQTAANCQNAHQWVIPINQHQQQQQAQYGSQQQQAQYDSQQQEEGQYGSQQHEGRDDAPQQQIDQEATFVDQSISPTASSENDNQQESMRPEDDNKTEQDVSQQLTAEPTVASFESSSSTASQGIRSSITVEDNGNKGSYLIYYPRPVSKQPVYWVQPSRTTSQGVVRLSPQVPQMPPSIASTVVSWSRPRVVVAQQFRTEQPAPNPTQESRAESTQVNEEVEESGEQQNSGQVSDEEIPYGQKLRDGNRGQKPYDIISVSGSDDEAQSLEELGSNDHSQEGNLSENKNNDSDENSSFTSSGNDETTGSNNESSDDNTRTSGEYYEGQKFQNEHNLQNVQETKDLNHAESDDSDDERDDFGLRPQSTFKKPISTTVIHSPGASSFQSLKLPNFKPQRVIVHDFTVHSATAAATGPSASASETQVNVDNSESQPTPSTETVSNAWKLSNKLKAPKLVDEEEEESSESINRPQGLSIQEVIASGPVSTADCLTTTHTGHLLTSQHYASPTSPRSIDTYGATNGRGRDIYLPIGSRFPGGRPSVFSAIRRPLPPSVVTTAASTTTLPSTVVLSNERDTYIHGNKKEREFGNSPSGFAASIPVPVYRRPLINLGSRDSLGRIEEANRHSSDSVTYIKPQTNIIVSAEDIYKNSETKDESNKSGETNTVKVFETSTSAPSPLENETIDSTEEIMSTERSSSFSVSVVDEKVGSSGLHNNEDEQPGLDVSNDLQQVEIAQKPSKVNVVQVTSIPVSSDVESIATTKSPSALYSSDSQTSTTPSPAPASTSTKIVKTVRVRQRMRSGSFNGQLRTRFHGPGRVRVVHRPANQEYIRHFPEFATREGEKLAKEEEQEVKDALIELKKSIDLAKTH